MIDDLDESLILIEEQFDSIFEPSTSTGRRSRRTGKRRNRKATILDPNVQELILNDCLQTNKNKKLPTHKVSKRNESTNARKKLKVNEKQQIEKKEKDNLFLKEIDELLSKYDKEEQDTSLMVIESPNDESQPKTPDTVDLTELSVIENYWKSKVQGYKQECNSNTKASDSIIEIEDDQTVEKTKNETKEKICSICLDALSENMFSTVCGHVFHGECIKNAVKKLRCCPVCRKRLNSKSVHPIFL